MYCANKKCHIGATPGNFCPQCGDETVKLIICKVCKSELTEGGKTARFCRICGTLLADTGIEIRNELVL